MSKIKKEEAEELKRLIANAAKSNEFESNAKSINSKIPKKIIKPIKKWENRTYELKKLNQKYSSEEYQLKQKELFGSDGLSGIFRTFLNWIDKRTQN